MREFWDSRYGLDQYAYGTEPNAFFESQLKRFNQGDTLIFPAEGEGRNAVYAAQNGMIAWAFDQSMEGKKKAEKLAESRNCSIEYAVIDGDGANYPAQSADGVVLIYAHFDEGIRQLVHGQVQGWLKPNGLVILEAFSKNHLEYQKKYPGVGGPKDISMLMSKETITQEFPELKFLYLEEVVVDLNEGDGHCGKGSVIRFIGEKK